MATNAETASWAEQVLDEHRELRALVVDIREFLEHPRPEPGEIGSHTWASQLAEYLLTLHDKLFRHFRTEERSGLFADLKARFPRATGQIDTVAEEHPQILNALRRQMTAALSYAQGEEPDNPRLRRRLGKLLLKLSKHEDHETRLIQRLTLRDLGEGD